MFYMYDCNTLTQFMHIFAIDLLSNKLFFYYFIDYHMRFFETDLLYIKGGYSRHILSGYFEM